MRVLIVADQGGASEQVRQFGHCVLSASSIDSAIRTSFDWQPAFILVDLTQIDGMELARQLRQNAHGALLIGITGYMDARIRQTAIDAGYDEFLAKPFRPNELASLLRRVEARLAESVISERRRVTNQLTREMADG